MSSELQNDQENQESTVKAKDAALALTGYDILGVLGTGGMSTVYKARQELMGRVVAIKVLHRYLANDPVHLQRFRQEARLSTMLEHPNIAALYSFGTSADGQPYLVMEYCEGQTLKEMMEKKSSFGWANIQDIFQQICAGLAHAHAHGVVHRDLKPANVFIKTNSVGGSSVKLIDFGIAKLDVSVPAEIQKLTKSGVIIGSPFYMSPEQCKGENVDGRSDIYAIGCMLYHILAGRTPFTGGTSLELAQKHVSEPPASLSEICASIDPHLEKLIHKAMAKSPADRYQTVDELKADLQIIHSSVSAVRPSLRLKVVKPTAGVVSKVLCVLAILSAAGFGAFALIKNVQPHSVAFESADRLFNSGQYEQAFPLLLKAQDRGNLSDEQANRLVRDLCDIAVIFKNEGNMLQRIHWIGGAEPWNAAADAAVQPMANRIDKFTACQAQLTRAQVGSSAREEHARNTLDVNGLSDSQREYCAGKLYYLDALNYQCKGKDVPAEHSYLDAIEHLRKAQAPDLLAEALASLANLYSDGRHVEQYNRTWLELYNLTPQVMKCHSRLAARDLTFVAANYMVAQKKFDEAAKTIDRVQEIYSKTAGGNLDTAGLYMAKAGLVAERDKDDATQLKYLVKALEYHERVNTNRWAVVDVSITVAGLQSRLGMKDASIETLQKAAIMANDLPKSEVRTNRLTTCMTLLADAQTVARRTADAALTRNTLIAVLQMQVAPAKERLLQSRSEDDANKFQGLSLRLAAQLMAVGKHDAARAQMQDELATLEKAVPPGMAYVHCYTGTSTVQDEPRKAIPYLEQAEKHLAVVGKTKAEREELLALRANIGCAYEMTGRDADAVTVLQGVEHELSGKRRINFWERNAPYALANAYGKSGRSTEALELYRKLMTPAALQHSKDLPAAREAEVIYKSLGGK